MHIGPGNARRWAVALIIGAIILGCGGPKRPGGEEAARIPAEAYLFDSKLIRDGKRTTIRLEVFQTDSVLGLNGRAYLGKGALKGKLTADTLAVYFPSENNYVYESIHTVLAETECGLGDVSLNVLQFFRTLPDSVTLDSRISVAGNYQDADKPKFIVFVQDCPWQMEMTYDRQETGWRIREFSFSNGTDLTLTASRREYKVSIDISPDKLQFWYPEDAEPLTL